MTERLKQLLDGEAHDLPVPPPATNAVISQGRGLRRRNRLTVAAGAVAAAVVVGGSVAALSGGGGERTAPDPASPTVGGNAVFSYGNRVFYDGPDHQTAIDDKAVKSLYYTSAGVLVRHGNNPYSDGGGPQRFSLVTPDGTVKRLGLVTEETVHASAPDEPYVVYGEAVDGELQVVVYDVEADAEAARVTVSQTSDGWFPVAIDGSTVYVQNGYDQGVYAVDWRDGTVDEADLDTVWEIAGGRTAADSGGGPAVVDVVSGDVLVTADGPGYFDLSPDGRFAQLVDEEQPGSGASFDVYDVDSGESITIDGNPYEWGWTADGDLFRVDENQVSTCDAATGDCTETPYDQPADADSGGGPQPPDLKLGGRAYES